MTTSVDCLLNDAARVLEAAGIENGRLEARLLMSHALDVAPETLIAAPERVLARRERNAFREVVARRRKREPMSHILGRREFWSLTFRVTADTLDPRPDSEVLIETLLEKVSDRAAPCEILDLGTGSGCLLLAALTELPSARGLGVDISTAALEVARANAEFLGVSARARFLQADWSEGLENRFDIILANPPYVPSAAIATLEPEVAQFEPRLALDGGPDGFDAYRAILPEIVRRLAPGGTALVEVGADQAMAVGALAAKVGFSRSEIKSDLAGRPRCLVFGSIQG